MFIALGIYNIIMGRRRQQQGTGKRTPWYKQLGILTGIEYVLLALAFLLNISIVYHWLPASLNGIVLPFYLVVLLSSGVLAGVVIYLGIMGRRSRSARSATPQTTWSTTTVVQELTPEEKAEHMQKRRERRQKAAAARRRRAGKA